MSGLACPNCGHVLRRDLNGSLSMTRGQRRALDALAALLLKGRAPSYEELRVAMGVKGRGTVHRHIVLLRQRGFVKPAPYYRNNSIELTPEAWELYRHG